MTKKTIRVVMSRDPVTLPSNTPLIEAARAMREQDIGDVLVVEGDVLVGIATDRDIVIRAIAQGEDLERATLGEICSREVATVTPDDEVGDAVRLMSEKAIRRLPVVEDSKPVGILSLGDLAIERDRKSALADISAASPNR